MGNPSLFLWTALHHLLDSLKDSHSNPRRRDRARRILGLIEEAQVSGSALELSGGGSLGFYSVQPDLDFEALELDRSNADHRLVATALGAQRGGADVILVTHDVTPRIAGNLVGIRAVDMPSAFLLPASEDPQAQEIRRLKADLEQERSRRPVLAVGVEGSQQVEIEWARQPLHIPRQVMDGVRSIQAETYPKPSRLYRNTDPALIPPDAQHLERGIAQHSRQVQDWLNTLNDYLRETSHLYLLAVELRNEGSAPATDVTLELSFPQGVEPSTRAVVPDPPPPPRPQFSSN